VATLIVPRAERLTLYPTLGWQVIEDIERYSIFGPGSLQEQPARLDDEKKYLIARFYEVYPMGHHLAGTRHFDRCSVELRKGVAKTELASWVTHMELHPWARVRFNGFDDHGELLPGKSVRSPYIPMMATAEEQVMELAFGVLKYIIEHSGEHANEPTSHLFDCTLERIIRLSPGGTNDGMAVPVSVAPSTRDGARTTFEHFDEPHHLYLPRERQSVETMLENLPKRQLETPWALFTSTAGVPGQGSVQEDVRAEAELIDEGRAPNSSLFFFGRWAGETHKDLSTVEKRVEAIKEATGPVGEWGKGQFERIARDYDRVGVDRMYWERVYLNRWRKSNAGAFDIEKVKTLVVQNEPLKRGSFVTVGFDGARRRDATAIVLTEIPTGRQQIAGLWERPEDAVDWECDESDVNGVMEQVFKEYDVWRAYCDPPFWVERVALWSGKWPDQVVEWWTNQPRKAAYMARAYMEAIDGEQIHYVGSEDSIDAMVRHVGHAGRKDLKIVDEQGKPLWNLQKLNGLPQNTFDACMAGNLSWQARLDAITSGDKPRNRFGAPKRLY
jgi:hypothetical protein